MSKDLESMKKLYSEFVRLGNCNPIEFLIQSRKMYDDVNILIDKSVNVFLLSVVRVGIGTLDYQRVYV